MSQDFEIILNDFEKLYTHLKTVSREYNFDIFDYIDFGTFLNEFSDHKIESFYLKDIENEHFDDDIEDFDY